MASKEKKSKAKTCTYVFIKGKREGETCGVRVKGEGDRCSTCAKKKGKKKKEEGEKKKGKKMSDGDKALKKEHEKSIKEAQKENKKAGLRGKVIVNKLPYRFAKDGNTKWPLVPGFKNINVTKGARGVWSSFSPMRMGPFKIKVDTKEGKIVVMEVKTLEGMHQPTKVWKGEFDEKKGRPKDEWYDRRDEIFASENPPRHIKKGSGENKNVPMFSWWEGEKKSYLEMRKVEYCPYYVEGALKCEGWKKLDELLASGVNVQVMDYDGYPIVIVEELIVGFFDLSRPFPHAAVLKCAEDKVCPWKDEVYDLVTYMNGEHGLPLRGCALIITYLDIHLVEKW
jgi:hypothetical protein